MLFSSLPIRDLRFQRVDAFHPIDHLYAGNTKQFFHCRPGITFYCHDFLSLLNLLVGQLHAVQLCVPQIAIVSAAAGKILCKKGYVLRHICRRQRCAVLQNYRIIVRVTHIPRIELVLIQREIIVIAICPIIGICNAVSCFLCHIHSRLLSLRYAQR